MRRDTHTRGYEPDQIRADLACREVESAAFIRPQRAHADIVVRFEPIEARGELPAELAAAFLPAPARPRTARDLDARREAAAREFEAAWAARQHWEERTRALSAMVHLRPTFPHPNLANPQ